MAWYNPADPVQRKWMLGGLLILAAVIPFRMYILTPRQAVNAELQGEVERLEAENRRASVLSAQGGGDLEERMALYERHVAKLEELIPGVEEVATLADEIASQGRITGVTIDRMVPEPR
jgi:Tfp pilus assembly protein PilO